jgi:hypothetical protein
MAAVVKDRFASVPQPLGSGGPVVLIGKVPYEVRRGALPNTFELSRAGAAVAYQVWVASRGESWSCTCPSAVFRPERMCKHASALATLRDLFREVKA